MYIKLGFHNAKANLNRTVMAFCVTAAAALILTVSLSTSSGFLHGQHLLLRYYLGADIAIFPGKLVFTPDELTQEGSRWQWSHYAAAWQNEAPGFLTRLPYDGILTAPDQTQVIDVHRVAQVVQGRAEVNALYPYYMIPAIATFPNDNGAAGRVVPLRGRDIKLDSKWEIAKYLANDTNVGPQLEEMLAAFAEFDGQPVCVINTAALPLGVVAPTAGEVFTVLVPTFDREKQEYDFTQLQPVQLYVLAHITVPVATYQVAEREHRPYYWVSDAIHMPLNTWKNIAALAGVDPAPSKVGQLGLVLSDTMSATRLAHELRHELPEYTVLTAAEMVNLLTKAAPQAGLPIDVDFAFHLLTILITSLIVATNAFLLVMQRRKEIAIMKSLGASYWNIVTLILSELVALSLIASLGGVALYRLLIINPALARFGTPWSDIWRQTFTIGGEVIGVLGLANIIFGLIPAFQAARTPVMEVLRDA
ncbi:MAG: ABC transporter permease [Firmicutes bacterium]|nr:ABC transporter permease [Bacillota bacterium]